MSDSLMSRKDRAKFLRDHRKRLNMARLYEKKKRGEAFFTTTEEGLAMAFASDKHMDSEIEWRHRELASGAREY